MTHELPSRGPWFARAGRAGARLDHCFRSAARGGAAITDEFYGNPDGSRIIEADASPTWDLYSHPVPGSVVIPAEPGIYRYADADGCYFDRRPARQRSIIVVPSTHDPAAHPDPSPDPRTDADPLAPS